MEEEKGQLVKRVERLKKRVRERTEASGCPSPLAGKTAEGMQTGIKAGRLPAGGKTWLICQTRGKGAFLREAVQMPRASHFGVSSLKKPGAVGGGGRWRGANL